MTSTTLGLDPTPDEPKPYTVVVWRYGRKDVAPFVAREDAVEFALAMMDEDCYVEGVVGPDGAFDDAADKVLRPWAYR